MSIIIYSGYGVGPFSLAQAEKTYSSFADDRSIQVQVHDEQTLWQALTQKGPAKKWLVLPGGGALSMAGGFPDEAKQEISDIWSGKKMEKLNLIGHCAGAVLLSQQLYTRHPHETAYSILDTQNQLLGVVPVSSICPLFLSNHEYDPGNGKAMRVVHDIDSDYLTLSQTFHSYSLLGPGFIKEQNARIEVIREMVFPFNIAQINASAPLYESDAIPTGLMYHKDENKASLNGDHIEFDPNDINEVFFNSRWDKYKNSLKFMKKKSEEEIEQIRKDSLSNFNSVKQTLIESNGGRKIALEDTFKRMDIPLKR